MLQKLKQYLVSNYALVLFATFIVRCLFVAFYPLNSYQFFTDSREYLMLANRALAGNFNFDIIRFVRSPLYPVLIALHKLLLGAYWEHGLVVTQIILSSVTVIFLCKIALYLFEDKTIELVTGLMYAIYLPVFYFVYSFTSETLYMFLNVLSMYYLVRLLYHDGAKNIFGYGISFTLAYLTRAEIMMFGPSAILLCLYFFKNRGIKVCLQGLLAWLILVLPWSLVNLKIHNSIITSSNGGPYVFYLSNSPLGYADAVKTPAIGSTEYNLMIHNYSFVNPDFDSIISLPQSSQSTAFIESAIGWIKKHPADFFQIRFWNAVNFFSPGLTIGHHDFKTWLMMFFITLPFHLLFYIGIYKAIKKTGLLRHLWFIAYYICIFIFLFFYLYTERFRAYSIEEYYLIYAAYAIASFKSSQKAFLRVAAT